MNKTLICINCPRGCHLQAEKNADQPAFTITGNRCPRGEKYAIQELTDPRRTVTAVVRCKNGTLHYLPVRTNAPLPRIMIENLLNRLYNMCIALPVKRGDIIIKNVENTGINVIASEDAQ